MLHKLLVKEFFLRLHFFLVFKLFLIVTRLLAPIPEVCHRIFVTFGNYPITWKPKKQSTVSKTSSEPKYRAIACVAAEITWIVRLLADLGVSELTPVILHCEIQ